jgi:hypothetical protein
LHEDQAGLPRVTLANFQSSNEDAS